MDSLETPTPTADIAALLAIIFIFRVLCLVVALVRRESHEISRQRSFAQARSKHSMMVTDVGGLAPSRRQTIVDEQGRRQTRRSFAHGASVKRGPFNANLLPPAVEEVELDGPRNEAAAGSGPGAVPVKGATLSAFSTV